MARLTGQQRFEGHEFPQVIPEPDQVEPGRAAPWENRDRSIALDLASIERRFRDTGRHFSLAELPGDPLELIAVADALRQPITRRSAVLVALFERDGESQVILTRRSFALRNHRGEIAFPGGLSDAGETPQATALREAHEEVDLDPTLVTPIGWLSPLVTFASGSAIWPIVGTLGEVPTLVAQPGEVDRVFTVSLAELLDDEAYLEERWRRANPRPGSDVEGFFPMTFFRVPGDLIWGATARVLTELLCVVTEVEWPEANRVWA